jgi:hypothetical protein
MNLSGIKIPVLYEIVRPVSTGDFIDHENGEREILTNPRGTLWWARPYLKFKEKQQGIKTPARNWRLVCADNFIGKDRLIKLQFLGEIIEKSKFDNDLP